MSYVAMTQRLVALQTLYVDFRVGVGIVIKVLNNSTVTGVMFFGQWITETLAR
jgi:hypothetical protein